MNKQRVFHMQTNKGNHLSQKKFAFPGQPFQVVNESTPFIELLLVFKLLYQQIEYTIQLMNMVNWRRWLTTTLNNLDFFQLSLHRFARVRAVQSRFAAGGFQSSSLRWWAEARAAAGIGQFGCQAIDRKNARDVCLFRCIIQMLFWTSVTSCTSGNGGRPQQQSNPRLFVLGYV